MSLSPLLYAEEAEISSSKAIIMLYFSGRVCYDLAGVRPVTTEISFEALERCPSLTIWMALKIFH